MIYKSKKFNSALKKINYRGPDFSDIYYDHNHNTYIGHNRLSIIDIKQGNQPFWSNKKKIAIVYNGEIYNYKILKKELHNQGASFQSNSDTEVILKMYEILGINSFNKFIHYAKTVKDNLRKPEIARYRTRKSEIAQVSPT